jgi:hypothetical protein
MTRQVRGGLSGKSEVGCMRVVVLTRDGGDSGATAFCEADGGGNDGISVGAAGAARGCDRGELGAGIGRRNSEDGSGRQGAATHILAWRSARKLLDVAALSCGTR